MKVGSGPLRLRVFDAFAAEPEVLLLEVLAAARNSAASPRLESQTASGCNFAPRLRMNGFGERPLPAAIAAIGRPEATERSSSSKPSPTCELIAM
jgi:hypothetical protein